MIVYLYTTECISVNKYGYDKNEFRLVSESEYEDFTFKPIEPDTESDIKLLITF